MKNNVMDIIKNKTLTYEMKVVNLAREAENSLDVLNKSNKTKMYQNAGVICDLCEGEAPYRPRYIVPDYDVFMKNGSEFLKLAPATDIWDAVNNLLILYKHVPSITSFPVYIGNIDTLLEPYIEDEKEAYQAIKFFLKHIDRTITDSFCHANIGPLATKAGRIILEVERELQNATPNITLKYSKDTSDEFAIEAIKTGLSCAKPSFANHDMFSAELGEKYGIASCYNGLHIGGGSYTLVRMVLSNLANMAYNQEHFFEKVLPEAMEATLDYMDKRVNFIVEESNFFESSFLVREGLISRDRFTAMFGLVGLAECVNTLLGATEEKERFGHSERANELGETIISTMYDIVNDHENKYCEVADNKFLLHAQVGIETDFGSSPGCRIPIGEEPAIQDHLVQSAVFHKYFPSGIGDIFKFDEMAKNNPKSILDIIKGAFALNMRYFSLYCDDCDVIRITGYLVKRSDIEALERGEQVLQDTVALGYGAVKNAKILERKLRESDK
ncbi:MAG: YjjI family glycine radical enzyme [Clostridium sp.]|uniref:YjjI family glycine radical enzyme n=1 Tax=Clostridium sp. TaxID=1506 RepID=UPI003054D4CF